MPEYMKLSHQSGVAGVIFVLALLLVPAAAAAADTSADLANDYFNAGVKALSTNDFSGAVGFFDQALAANTSVIARSDTLMYLYQDKAYALIQLNRYDDALNTAEAGLVLYHGDNKLWNNKGYALSRLGRYREAVTAYNQAIAIDENYTTALINKGDALYQLGEYQASVSAYSNALRTDPNNTDATEGLKRAQEAADTIPLALIAAIAIVFVLIVGGLVWYTKFRKPETGEGAGRREDGKKKGKNKNSDTSSPTLTSRRIARNEKGKK